MTHPPSSTPAIVQVLTPAQLRDLADLFQKYMASKKHAYDFFREEANRRELEAPERRRSPQPLPGGAGASTVTAPEREAAREVTEPVYKAVLRILDEKSAWVAAPNDDVARAIAIAATTAAFVEIEKATPTETPPPAWLEWVADTDEVFTLIEKARALPPSDSLAKVRELVKAAEEARAECMAQSFQYRKTGHVSFVALEEKAQAITHALSALEPLIGKPQQSKGG